MKPEILFRIFSNRIFNAFHDALGVNLDVSAQVLCFLHLHRRIQNDREPIIISNTKSRNNRNFRSHSQHGDARRCQYLVVKKHRMKVGVRLRRQRLDKGFSQQSIASDIRVATSTISCWGKGDRAISLDHLFLFSEYFGIEPKTLFDGES